MCDFKSNSLLKLVFRLYVMVLNKPSLKLNTDKLSIL